MTDEQIENVLERIGNSRCSDITNFDYLEALDYINRLKDENERLSVALKLAQTRANDAEEKLRANLEKAYEHSEQECNRCMEKVEFKHGLSLDATEERVRKETAKEILTYVGNLSDDCDDRIKLKDYQWHKNLCQKYGVEVEE